MARPAPPCLSWPGPGRSRRPGSPEPGLAGGLLRRLGRRRRGRHGRDGRPGGGIRARRCSAIGGRCRGGRIAVVGRHAARCHRFRRISGSTPGRSGLVAAGRQWIGIERDRQALAIVDHAIGLGRLRRCIRRCFGARSRGRRHRGRVGGCLAGRIGGGRPAADYGQIRPHDDRAHLLGRNRATIGITGSRRIRRRVARRVAGGRLGVRDRRIEIPDRRGR